MRFSHSWLKQYVAIADEPERVGRILTAAGVPLDGIEGSADDAVYDFEILTNRPDCMNHLGLAREYAAVTGGRLLRPPSDVPSGGPPTSESAAINIEGPELCARYSARCILGVHIGPSPEWLVRRLASIGQRSINNVVDVTNFVLWEMGQPLHSFDLDRLDGRRIIVRRARAGERMVTLDGETRTLTADMLVIADARRPVALAGVMGGQDSEVSPSTTNLLLESAWFEPVSVRRTARALGLHTDASHRFERGADPEATLITLNHASVLIAEVAGGTISDPPLDVHPRPEPVRIIRFRPTRARRLLGLSLPEPVMKESLERLEFGVTLVGEDAWDVAVPTFRRDVTREVDLIEEVIRQRGYDSITSDLPSQAGAGAGRSQIDRRSAMARRALQTAGLNEAINFVMADRVDEEPFAVGGTAPLAIENPLQSQAAWLRMSLLPGLLRNVAHNLNRGLSRCHLYEIGAVFLRGPERLEERRHLAFVLAGQGLPMHWSLRTREVDLYDARGTVELLAEMLGLSPLTLSSDRMPFLVDGRALRIALKGRPIGWTGQIVGGILERLGIEQPVYGCQIDFQDLDREAVGARQYRPLPRYPGVRRDLALIVKQDVPFAAIERVVRSVNTVPIEDVQPFDRYRGPGVPEGCVSVAVQISFRHAERTLTSEEVQAAQDKIVSALERELGTRLRGPAGS